MMGKIHYNEKACLTLMNVNCYTWTGMMDQRVLRISSIESPHIQHFPQSLMNALGNFSKALGLCRGAERDFYFGVKGLF